ncbi:hypothetical protein CR156_09750 [Stenotrophomonas lactitubi]|nr:hypothetical protein CR156_09750 [Stenotrophomonas lactitubi]
MLTFLVQLVVGVLLPFGTRRRRRIYTQSLLTLATHHLTEASRPMGILNAAERTRQNGEPEPYVGGRVMRGLVIFCQSLCAQAAGWLQREG